MTSMTPDQVTKAAAALDQAEKTRKQIGILSLAHAGMDMDDAYAVQAEWVKQKLAAGRRKVGWKIGLTSKAMQYALNIDIPDSGILLDDMVFGDGAVIPADRFIQPRIEAEIAFVMKAPLKGNVTIFDVLNATDFIVPAIEILDTRIVRVDAETKKIRTVFDTIADNAANAGIVMGGRPMRPLDTDMRWIGAIVSKNGEVEETGLGAGVLNHPATAVAWLANRLAQYGGGSIEAGDIVLSGSFVRPVECPHGSTILADYGPFGTVSCHFA